MGRREGEKREEERRGEKRRRGEEMFVGM